MKRSKKILLLLGIVGLFLTVAFFYRQAKVISRKNLVERFFDKESDLIWARKFLGKKVDFCKQQWSETDSEDLISLTGRYEAEQPYGEGDASDFVIHDRHEKRVAMTVPSEWPPFGSQLKWILNDRYILIFRAPSHDDDFETPTVGIGNVRTGQIIYFVDATESQCQQPH